MFYNHLKLTVRTLLKFKGYTTINLLGLSIGVAVGLLLWQHIQDDLSYDQHHQEVEQLYRVSTHWVINNEERLAGGSESPLAKQLVADFPEVLAATRVYKVLEADKFILQYQDRHFFERKAAFADTNFFEVLEYDFVYGDPSKVLDEPFSIVLSQTIAEKLFGDRSPIGEVIQVSSPVEKADFKVTGVFKTDRFRSHLQAGFYAAGHSGKIGNQYHALDEWVALNLYYTYIKLHPEADPKQLEAAFPQWYDQFASAGLKEYGIQKSHFLQPVTDIYLDSEVSGFFFGKTGSKTYVRILFLIGMFILLIACINFMNLSTAKATQRSREVGVRKVMGASRSSLIQQFLGEAFLYSLLAVAIAFTLAKVMLPHFNQLTDKSLHLHLFSQLPILLGIVLSVTLLAGAYPAFYLSAFDPVQAFRQFLGNKFSAVRIRRGLVVLQFIIGVALIQGVLVIQEQLAFIQQKELGFNPEAKIVIPLNSSLAQDNYSTLRERFLQNSQVKAVGGTTAYPGVYNPATLIYFREGQTAEEGFQMLNSGVTPEYIDLMGFQLLAGRQFDPQRMSADTGRTAVISRAAMKGLGYTLEEVIGERISLVYNGDTRSFEVIGVIEDFHSESLHNPVQGEVFDWTLSFPLNFAIASVETKDLPASLKALQESWQQVNPSDPFEYYFLEEKLQQAYQSDQQMSQLIFWAMLLAIFIACLGLLGLAAFATEKRRKEIGIRKVLGASVGSIITLLSRDFLRLVVIALLIATPLTWLLMNKWLMRFAYRIEMPWAVFGLGAVLAIVVAMATVSLQGLKAAVVNPSDSLKNE